VYPEDLPRLKAHQQKFPSAQDGHILELDYRLKHRSGEWRWFRCRDQVFARTADGWPKQIFGTAQDITEYKRAEEALRQQNERELLMATITQHIRQSLDLGEVLRTTCYRSAPVPSGRSSDDRPLQLLYRHFLPLPGDGGGNSGICSSQLQADVGGNPGKFLF